jgi:aminopeptidase N
VRLRLVAPAGLAGLLAAGCGGQAALATHPSTPAAGPAYTAAISHPIKDPYYPSKGTTSVDTLHYGLDLTWNAGSRQLSGTAAIRFRATRSESAITLDLAAPMQVASVRLDGAVVPSSHAGHKLTIATGALARNSRHTVAIRYSGNPQPVAAPTSRSDIPGVGWTVQPSGQVWSIQEPYGAFTWYPVNDQPSDKAYYDITWHTQPTWSGVSNGQLVSDTVVDGQRVMHWHLASPAASYLVAVAIGPYREHRDTGPHGLPITYWVRPKDASVLPALRRTPAMLRWLEAHLGPYPFETLGAVVEPTNSAEETQTMVSMGASVLKEGADGLPDLLHEYSHQWYGDTVTPNNWKDLWLNESFAMYIQFRWDADHHFGSMAHWRAQMNSSDQQLRTEYGPPGSYDRNNFAELDVYYCGARMLDRLHAMLGNTVFAKVLRDWPQQHRFATADRSEWISYLDHVTGRNLRSFVHRWLTSPTSPA